MGDAGTNQHSMQSTIKAVGRKLRTVRFPKKIKTIRKLCLRLVGVHQKLYLEGYYEEDVDNPESADTSKGSDLIQCKDSLKDSYIAIAVDNLDKGGLEQVILFLANEWKKSCREVKVLCMKDGGEIAERLQKESGIEVIIFHSDLNDLKEFLLKNPPWVANTHFIHEGIEVFYELGIPIVEVIHNMYVFLDYNQWNYEKKKSKYINQYIAVSQCAKEVFLKKAISVFGNGIPEERITVIGNTFEPDSMVENEGEEDREKQRIFLREQLGIPKDAFVFLSVGSIDPRKNNLGMICAFSALLQRVGRDTYLIMVGQESNERYAKKVRRFALNKKINDKLIFTGQRSDVKAFMNASDVFLMISYYEGWSVAATEALSSGLPLIHSECGSATELISDGRNGILVQNPIPAISEYDLEDLDDAMFAGVNENQDEIVEAMQSMIDNEAVWKQRKTEIALFAKGLLNTREVADRYEKIFERAAGSYHKS